MEEEKQEHEECLRHMYTLRTRIAATEVCQGCAGRYPLFGPKGAHYHRARKRVGGLQRCEANHVYRETGA